MILYLDTSAYAKLILQEAHADEARDLFAAAEHNCCSVITLPEAASALARHARKSHVASTTLDKWLTTLNSFWELSVHVPVFERTAACLGAAHLLRGMDAVQLASAVELRSLVEAETPGADLRFLAFDRQLLEAAQREGFATLSGPAS